MQSEQLAKQVRELRLRADLSLDQFAAMSGVGSSTISRIESGDTTDPGYFTLQRLAHALGFGGVDEMLTAPIEGYVVARRGGRPRKEPRTRHVPLRPVQLAEGVVGWLSSDVDVDAALRESADRLKRIVREAVREELEGQRGEPRPAPRKAST